MLTAMGLNPLLTSGALPAGQSVTNTNVALKNRPTATDIFDNSVAGSEVKASHTKATLAAANAALTTAEQQLTTNQALATAGQTKLSSAKTQLAADQTAVLLAHKTATNALANASAFNQSLQQSVKQQYINQYANAVDDGRATN